MESASQLEQERPAGPAPYPSEVGFQAIDISTKAMATQAILDIANANGWHSAITHFLRTKGVPYLSDLTQPQVEDLLGRMRGYVDAAEMGCSLPDCLPAS